jgi:hypothetical protein
MDFFAFLKDCQTPQFFDRYKTICFRVRSDAHPLLFFSYFVSAIKKQVDCPVESVCVLETDSSLVMAKLSTSFLGMVSLYWFKNIAGLKPKKSKELIDFLKSYDGPNSVLFAVDETVACSAQDFNLTITVPDKIGHKEFIQLFEFFYGQEEKIRTQVLQQLLTQVTTVNVDGACLLMQYMRLAGRGSDEFLKHWIDKIIAPEHSLLLLSSHFFARDKQQFFSLWMTMEQDYAPQFWISFWSELLWRAYFFVEQSNKRQYAEAKRVSFRLPHNFTQKLWAQASLIELRNAHDFLYSVDCSLKNGGAATSLELLYTNYFTGQFQADL